MTTKEKVLNYRENGCSIPEICERLNISKGTVGYHLKGYRGLNYKKRICKTYVDIRNAYGDEIILLYKNKKSIVFISQNYKVSQFFIIKFLKEKGIYVKNNRKLDIKNLLEGKVFYKNPYYSNINHPIKEYIALNKILDYKCGVCGILEWNGEDLNLELDHIDGDRNNNNIGNLRFICPNCHSQTTTYKGKKRKN
jgi:hypothetical protein